jgi:hypothetical protein
VGFSSRGLVRVRLAMCLGSSLLTIYVRIQLSTFVYFIHDAKELATQVLYNPHHALQETALVSLATVLVNLVAYQ